MNSNEKLYFELLKIADNAMNRELNNLKNDLNSVLTLSNDSKQTKDSKEETNKNQNKNNNDNDNDDNNNNNNDNEEFYNDKNVNSLKYWESLKYFKHPKIEKPEEMVTTQTTNELQNIKKEEDIKENENENTDGGRQDNLFEFGKVIHICLLPF